MLHSIKLLGTTITSEKEDKILEYVIDQVKHGTKKLFITTPNPEILVYARSYTDYQDKLNSAGVALPDGVGLLLGGWILGKPIAEKVTGVDFIEKLCLACRENPMSMGFLGGRGGVAELTAQRLVSKYPWLKISFIGEEWSQAGFVKAAQRGNKQNSTQNNADSTVPRPVPSGSAKSIDILFVAYGFPKQEEWIYENLPHLPVKAAMGVGGSFDYISGKVPRAPKFIRALGLEWFFRLVRQPWRWKRQLSLIRFLFLIFKEKFKSKKSS